MSDLSCLVDDEVALPGGPVLAVRRAAGDGRPFLLVHGLASNARMWDGVAQRLSAAGHPVVAVDQRGHGRSEETPAGYGTEQCAADLATLCVLLGFTGKRAPVVAGQSWGGNVALTLAARFEGVVALALVDGGWIRLAGRFPTFERCWQALEPPHFDGMSMAELAAGIRRWHPDWPGEAHAGALSSFKELPDGGVQARLSRDHHREILHSLWAADPRLLYPLVNIPVLLVPAIPNDPDDRPRGESETQAANRSEVAEALALLPQAELAEYAGADHDLHAQYPDRLAGDLLSLAARAEAHAVPGPVPDLQETDAFDPGAVG